MPDTLDDHCKRVITAISEGRVIPFFGAGVNLFGRAPGLTWQRGCKYLPSGGELAEYLASMFRYPWSDKHDLVRVTQYAAVMGGLGPLYRELHNLFNVDYPLTPLHRFFATIPKVLRNKGSFNCYPLIVTTNYDNLMERAFEEVGEPFDLVIYVAEDKEQRGRFWHLPPGGEKRPIERPNKYSRLSLDQRPVILKLNGAVDRKDEERDSFVITEDNYIDYLTRTDISTLMPVTVAAKLRNSHFLFLGYSLRDWNLRVILRRLWGEQKLSWKSWSIQVNPHELDEMFWRQRNVDILDVSLEDYIFMLNKHMQAH